MCLAIHGKVKKISGRQALVEYPGETRQALIGEKGVKVGDFVMVQMGVIVKVLSRQEVCATQKAWQKK